MKVLQQTFLSGECYIPPCTLSYSSKFPSSFSRSALPFPPPSPSPSPHHPTLLPPLLHPRPSWEIGRRKKDRSNSERSHAAAAAASPLRSRRRRNKQEEEKTAHFSLSLSLSLSPLPRSYLSIHRLYRTAPSLPLSNQFLFPLPSCFSTCRIARCNNDGSSLRPAEAKVGVGGEVIEKSAAEGTER